MAKRCGLAQVELVSAVNGQGRRLGTVAVQEGSHEIPAARPLLGQVPVQGETTLECREVTPEQVSFPGTRLIARLTRRVRRQGKKSTETVYLISSLTLEQLDAAGWSKLKRGYRVIESRLHQALDLSLDEDRSRVRQPHAALVLGMIRQLVVSVAQAAIGQVQTR